MKILLNLSFLAAFFSCGLGSVIPDSSYDLFLSELKFYNAFLEKDFDSNTYVYTLFVDEEANFSLNAKANLIIAKIVVNESKFSNSNNFNVELTASEIENNTFTIKINTATGRNENKYTFNVFRKKFVFLEKIKIFLPNEPEKELVNLNINATTMYPDLVPYNNIEIEPIVPEDKKNLVDIYVDGVLLVNSKAELPIIEEINNFKIEIKPKPGQNIEEVFYNLKFEKTTAFIYSFFSYKYTGFKITEPVTNEEVVVISKIEPVDYALGNFVVHDFQTNQIIFFMNFNNEKIKFKYLGNVYTQEEGVLININDLTPTNDRKYFIVEAFIEGSTYLKKYYGFNIIKYSSIFLDHFYLKDTLPGSDPFFEIGDGTQAIKTLNYTMALKTCKLAYLYFSPSFEDIPSALVFTVSKNGTPLAHNIVNSNECNGALCYFSNINNACSSDIFEIKVGYKDIEYKELIYTFSFNDR